MLVRTALLSKLPLTMVLHVKPVLLDSGPHLEMLSVLSALATVLLAPLILLVRLALTASVLPRVVFARCAQQCNSLSMELAKTV